MKSQSPLLYLVSILLAICTVLALYVVCGPQVKTELNIKEKAYGQTPESR